MEMYWQLKTFKILSESSSITTVTYDLEFQQIYFLM